MRSMRPLAVVLALGVALLAGCGGSTARLRSEPGAARPHRAAPLELSRHSVVRPSCRVESAVQATSRRSFAALVRSDTRILSRPAGGRVLARVSRRDQNGYPTVLGVLGAQRTGRRCAPSAYLVQVPVPPNLRAGWIPARAVRVFAVRSHIVVDLSGRRLVAYRNGRAVLRARVAIGAPQTPTPTGRYFINERWLLADPNGVFGVAALGISAHSNVLRNWVQNGPIALHGTNEPGTIGLAASHGCVRLSNADMRRLLALAPAGTPVTIRP